MASGYYDITTKILGRGHYGVVKLARHCLTGEPVAMKIIEKSRLNNDSLNLLGSEIRILFRLSEYEHPNILKLYQTIDTADKLFLVTEYCGPHACDLHDYLLRKNTRDGLGEKEAQIFFIQICSAISYCHSMGIVHRDLKPENILVTDYKHMYTHPPSKDGRNIMLPDLQYPLLKLIDFGFANQWSPDEKMRTSCGTLAYSAPELLLGEPYDGTKVDVWGLGLMLYILLYGGNPFMQLNDNETLTKILDCSFATPTKENVDYDAVELLRSLIKRNPDTRLAIDSILRHKWFSGVPKPLELTLKYESMKSPSTTTKTTTTTLAQAHQEVDEVATPPSPFPCPTNTRPTTPDVGGKTPLSDEEQKLHDLVIQDMFRLTKLIDSASVIEASLRKARFNHRQFNQNSIQPAAISEFNNSRRKISTGSMRSLIIQASSISSSSRGDNKHLVGGGGDLKADSPSQAEEVAQRGSNNAAADNLLGVINSKLNNDDYIYATYQLTRDRILRKRQEKMLRGLTKDDNVISSSRPKPPPPQATSSQEAIPEEEDGGREGDAIGGGPSATSDNANSGGRQEDRTSAVKENDTPGGGGGGGASRLQQRKLLLPQHRMRDKFTSFFRSGSTSPSLCEPVVGVSGGQQSQQPSSSHQQNHDQQHTNTLSPNSSMHHHEAFSDHNNQTNGASKAADSYENSMAYALPLARKCSIVSEESGCSNVYNRVHDDGEEDDEEDEEN